MTYITVSIKLIRYTILYSTIAFLVLSIPTAVFRNPFFMRMTPVFWFDYVFLVVNSLLIGLYYALTKTGTNPHSCKIENKSIFAQFLALFGIACPICNKLLVFLFSIPVLLTFLEPIRPFISLGSSLLLLWFISKKLKLQAAKNISLVINHD